MSFEKEIGRDKYFAQLEKELASLIDPQTGLVSSEYARWIQCPLCKASDHEALFVKRGYPFVRCLSCELIFANPQVFPKVIETAYTQKGGSTELWMKVLLSQKEQEWRKTYNSEILRIIEENLSTDTPPSNKRALLDIGSGVGSFLVAARESGWDTLGLELSPIGYNYSTKQLGLNVINSSIQDSRLEPDSFDAITLLGVLEHLPDPCTILSRCLPLLRPGGIIAAVVPNAYSLLNLFLRDKSATFDGRNHLMYFSSNTLAQCFSEVGLKPTLLDSVLTGLPNLLRYIQYRDPYSTDRDNKFVPPLLHNLINSPDGRLRLESMIIENNLGLRLRMFAHRDETLT